MRTNIAIDDQLMADAMRVTGAPTKKQTVERGLRAVIRQGRANELRSLRGRLQWDGDLDAERTEFAEPAGQDPW
jgi:Arc/MetJ family transcription regulator